MQIPYSVSKLNKYSIVIPTVITTQTVCVCVCVCARVCVRVCVCLHSYMHAHTCTCRSPWTQIIKARTWGAISYVLCLVTQSRPNLCNPMDCSPSVPSVHGDSPGKNTGMGSMASSRESSQPRDLTQVSCIAGGFVNVWAIRESISCRNG